MSAKPPSPYAFAVSLLATTSALAQTAPEAAPAPAATVADVTVVAERPAVVNAIDRKVYAVSRDLVSANGSISDALRNLPSVEVDVEGNVSLRGESSVQFLIDGKPSSMVSSANRAQYLQQLPANTVESIEVITNPSAEFSPDGTGGIINIVTKKVRRNGPSGSVQAGVGSYGRGSANALGAYKAGKLSLSGNVGGRRNHQQQRRVDETTSVDANGARSDRLTTNEDRFEVLSVNANGSADYDLTPKDRLSATVGGVMSSSTSDSTGATTRRDAAGAVTDDYETLNSGDGDSYALNISGRWRHTFAQAGRTFDLSLRHGVNTDDGFQRQGWLFRTPAGTRTETRRNEQTMTGSGLTAAFVLPLGEESSLKAGYEYRHDVSDLAAEGLLIDPAGGETNLPEVTNHFVYVQANHQAYATWQRPFGKLVVLGGLRLELAQIKYDQRTGAIAGEAEYTDIHPTLHLQYPLTGHQTLSASYSHRVSRPGAEQLNPFVSVNDAFTAFSGNPLLRPQETHSVETGWEWRDGARSASATLYYRRNYNTIGSVSRFLSPTLILNTFENQGTSTNGGLELDAGGPLGERLTWRGNLNISYSEIERSSLAGGDVRSDTAYRLRLNLDYKPTDRDLIQITGAYTGRQITAQGYRLPTGGVNLGYQHKFRPNLIGVVTLSDVFDTQRRGSVIDTPTLFGRNTNESASRTLSLGLTRTFGGRAARDGQFEYDN
jgi:outer membrane receptor protein involved in Fe transport